jgi:hypothetical protein
MVAGFVKACRCWEDRVQDRNPENNPEIHRGRWF